MLYVNQYIDYKLLFIQAEMIIDRQKKMHLGLAIVRHLNLCLLWFNYLLNYAYCSKTVVNLLDAWMTEPFSNYLCLKLTFRMANLIRRGP